MALAKVYGCSGLDLLNAMKRTHQNALYLSGGLGDAMEKITEKQYRKILSIVEDINQEIVYIKGG